MFTYLFISLILLPFVLTEEFILHQRLFLEELNGLSHFDGSFQMLLMLGPLNLLLLYLECLILLSAFLKLANKLLFRSIVGACSASLLGWWHLSSDTHPEVLLSLRLQSIKVKSIKKEMLIS